MEISVLFVTIFVSCISSAVCVCPSGWQYRDQHCYFIFKDLMTRGDASDHCKAHMGYLVSYANQDEWDFISTLYQRSSYQHIGVWIGLEFVFGQWTWMDGTYPFKALSNWYSPSGKAVKPPTSVAKRNFARMSNPSGQDVVMSIVAGDNRLHPFCKRHYDSRELCPYNQGWTTIDGRCYKSFPPVSHSNAFPICTAHNAKVFLPTINHDTMLESVFLVPELDSWVGATRNSTDSDVFVTPNGQNVTYLPWLNSKSKTKAGDNSNETCLAASKPDTTFGFVLEDCHNELTLICEKQKGSCPLGWYQQGEDCYRWYLRPDEKVTWHQAVDQCKDQGASLVQPTVPLAARRLLHSALQDNDVQAVWFGFKGGKKGYLTLDKQHSVPKVVQYDTTDLPDNFERCGVTDYDENRTTPVAEYCFLLKNFVCTMKRTDNIKHKKIENLKCDDGWVLLNGQCFKLMKRATDYFKASTLCQIQKASLAFVTNEAQQSLFSTDMFFAYGQEDFWIGVKFDKSRIQDNFFETKLGSYVLQNGNEAGYLNMAVPNATVTNSKLCVVVETGSLTAFPGIWKPEQCVANHLYVCQKKAVIDQQKVVSPALVSWSPRCGPGWFYSNKTGYCYWINQFTFKTWSKARDDCKTMNSDLLSISSGEEQAAISSIFRLPEAHDLMEPMWIGAADKGSNFGWSWSDKRAFAFFYWGEAQPDYSSVDGNNCGIISIRGENRWESRPCEKQLPFICKRFAKPEKDEKPQITPKAKCVQGILVSGGNPIQSDQAFTASSYKDDQHTAAHLRMVPYNHGAWRPAKDEQGEWVQISFPSPITMLFIVLRGGYNTSDYVTKFKVQHRYDETSPWYWIEKNNTVWIMDGVVEEGETSTVILPHSIKTSSIRVWPVEWSYGIALQMDVIGCQPDQCKPEFGISGPLIVKDSQITVSSGNSESWRGRLRPVTENKRPVPWLSLPSDKNPWIQVDFGKLRLIRGLKLRSGPAPGKYMSKFKLLFSEAPGSKFVTYTQPFGTPYIFNGLTAEIHEIEVYLTSSFRARLVRLVAVNVTISTNLFFDVFVCPVGPKSEPLMASVPDSALSASVTSDPTHSPEQSRLQNTSVGWRPGPNVKGYESYIQVDLETVVHVSAVATQGSQGSWTRSYFLSFSKDGVKFDWYKADNGNKNMLFTGNFDDITVVKNELPVPVEARYVRLMPVDLKNEIVVKWEVYAQAKLSSSLAAQGCYGDNQEDPDLPYAPLVDDFMIMNPDLCISHCYNKGYRYAGIQAPTQDTEKRKCSCGNDYGVYGTSDTCHLACQSPYSKFSCGGFQANAMYSTGIGPRSLVCKGEWMEHGDSCYRLFVETDTWFGAQKACQKIKGQLVDIRSRDENAFVTYLMSMGVTNSAWIGLNDNEKALSFHWTSGNDGLDYTQWGYHQPVFNPGLEQHGVIIDLAAKGWRNVFSESSHSFVCKTAKSPSQAPRHTLKDPGCSQNFYAFRDKCYMFNHIKQSWKQSVTLCSLMNATIASVLDQPDSLFFSEKLSSFTDQYWIGVAADKASGQFVDTVTTQPIMFANWNQMNPGDFGKCVSLGTGHKSGLWSSVSCEDHHYFVCQKPRRGFLPIPHPTPPTVGPCPDGWLAHTTHCYQPGDTSLASMLTWYEASAKCSEIGATLASFHNEQQLKTVVSSSYKFSGSFWIGLNNLDENAGYRWTDGSVTDFVLWGFNQPPSGKSPSKCGELDPTTRTFRLQVCSNKKGFLCSIRSGQTIKNVKPVVFPTPDTSSNVCTSSSSSLQWFHFGDYCYHLSNGVGGKGDTLTWRESQRWCQSQGADLASITSQMENDFIQGMEQGQRSFSSQAAWIGLNQLDRGRGYRWIDGSPVGSWKLNWNVNEPNNEDGFQACVAMQIRIGKWNDEHCSTRQGFVCKKPARSTVTRPPVGPVPILKGYCPTGFKRLASKCYRLYGVTKGELRLPWNQARKACQGVRKDLYSDLVSVSSLEENAIVTLLLRESKESAWLGLRRVSYNGPFLWADEQDLTFLNWNKDEPNMPVTEACVYMYGPTKYAGLWNDVSCQQAAPYVCQTLVDPHIPKPPRLPSTDCPPTYVKSDQSCIKVVNASTSWSQALHQCKQDGATLTSVLDAYDLARTIVATSVGLETDVWIGLNDMLFIGYYKWSSKYPVTFTPWAPGQPADKLGWDCAYLTQDGMFGKDACTEDRSFICQLDLKEPVINPPLTSTECRDKGFSLMGTSCYSVNAGSQYAATYEDALRACKDKGATLTSIGNDGLSFNIPPGTSLWIGLRKSLSEGFSWEDGAPLGYTRWAVNQWSLSSFSSTGPEQNCVSIDSKQNWAIRNCADKLGFICIKHPDTLTRIIFQSSTTTAVPPPTVSKGRPSPSPIHQHTPTEKTHPPLSSTQQSPKLQSTSSSTTRVVQTQTSTTQAPAGNRVKKGASTGSGGMTKVQTAGTVIGVFLAVALVAGSVMAYFKREQLRRTSAWRQLSESKKRFESSLYHSTDEDHNENNTHNGHEIHAQEDIGLSVMAASSTQS